jgi:uncharacterized protein (DUF2236 family)
MSGPPLAVSQRIHAERLILLGWSRAILLQLAHPLMAAAVATHSSFGSGPVAAVIRLRRTIRAMLDLTFGDDAARGRALAAIRTIHNRVNGTLSSAVGPFATGTGYSANDPDLLLWVHVTVLDSVALAYETFVRPLSSADRDAYCVESAPVAIDLGADPVAVPRTWHALTEYIAASESSGVLVVSNEARSVAAAVLSPPMSTAIWPAAWLNRQFTVGNLPAEIRRQYGFEWHPASAGRVQHAARLVRGARRLMPQALAVWRTSRR